MKAALTAAILVCVLFGTALAEEPVSFADANLKAVVEDTLWVSDPTPSDMEGLIRLYAGSQEIESLVGIEYAKNLQGLYLRLNNISDISPLASLTNLQSLVLHRNPLSDLSPLSGLTNLHDVDLNETAVTDLSALTGLTSLTLLKVQSNALTDEAYQVQIPQIQANNPGIEIYHDRASFTLTITSTTGGSVTDPGEGTFVFANGTNVCITAQADPCCVFTHFSGTVWANQNPLGVLVTDNSTIQANFESTLDTLYVDGDAPGDAGHGNMEIGDPLENGTAEHPYDSIQEAIDVAADGAVIVVRPGTYLENLAIPAKSIRLTGRDPNAPAGTPWPVIQAAGNGSVVSIASGAASHCSISGFVVTQGKGQGSTIVCRGAATLSHCLIVGNRAEGLGDPLVQCTDGDAAFINCTIADNYVRMCNAVIQADNSAVTVANSIFYYNSDDCWEAPETKMFVDEDSRISIRYSDIMGGWPGEGNIDGDPLFACRSQWLDPKNPGIPSFPSDSLAVWVMGDYHLQSAAGRLDPAELLWLHDDIISPCIDAGDPNEPVPFEPAPNGRLLNMGVYGGTTEASKSL